MPTLEIWVSLHLEKYNIQYVCREQNIQEQHKKKYILTTLVTWRSTMYSTVRVDEILLLLLKIENGNE